MIVDCREHGLIAELRGLSTDITTQTAALLIKQLPIADIWIGATAENNPAANGLLIERKAVADLEASILDGRYREQRARLLSAATEAKAHPVYIIEGDLDRLGPVRLAGPALMKHITRLMLRYHIAVFQTSCVRETAQLLLLLQNQWAADPTTFEQPAQLSYVEAAGGAIKSANRDSPGTFAAGVLQLCRGVSPAAAQAILAAHGGTLQGVLAVDESTLATTIVGKRKLGPTVAGRLYGLLHAEKPS